jgi:hypothetical protein
LNDITKNSKVSEKNEKEKTEEEEEEEEEDFYDRTPQNAYQPQPVVSTLKELPKFDASEFHNIENVGADVKELLTIMSKYYIK